jgi:hypothetical protein
MAPISRSLRDRLDQEIEGTGAHGIERSLGRAFGSPDDDGNCGIDLGQHRNDAGVQPFCGRRINQDDPDRVAMAAEEIDTGMRGISDMDGMAVRFNRSLHAAALGGIFIDE